MVSGYGLSLRPEGDSLRLNEVMHWPDAPERFQPQALARLVGWRMTLKELALRMRVEVRQEGCGRGGGGEAAVRAECRRTRH
jgi:hypothetical protein